MSYSSKDAPAAVALSRYIETFRVPVRLGGKEQRLPKRMTPVFRDRDEFSASSDLGTAIQDALAKSGAIIVLCSPDSAQSKWVDEEIRRFRQIGNPQRIFPVLLKGEPSEAFPPALSEEGREPLAVDFRPHKDTRRDGRLRLVAALLGVDFDALKRRERIRIRNARLRTTALAALVLLLIVSYPVGLLVHSATQPKITEYYTRTGDSVPNAFTEDSDGALWFTERPLSKGKGASRVGRAAIGPGGKVAITEYPIPTNNVPDAITAGPGGTLWFTEFTADEIGQVAIGHNGKVTITEYPIPGPPGLLWAITTGPDGALWFTETPSINQPGSFTVGPGGSFTGGSPSSIGRGASRIGRASIDRDGKVTITEYTMPMKDSMPIGITRGPDGALWFTDGYGRIGRAAVGRGGNVAITEYATPTKKSVPWAITKGPDGALWFTEMAVDNIGRAVIGRDGKVIIAEYPTPTQYSTPMAITAGPDHAVWFTESMGGRIGRASIDRRGNVSISEYEIPKVLSEPIAITVGPDGALWFSESPFPGIICRITTGGFKQL